MRINDFLKISWEGGDQPLIEPPFFSPVIADPSFLFPEESPDGAWTLYAHSAWGLHEYTSVDGKCWIDRGLRIRNAMRPFIRRMRESNYALLYEKYKPFALPLQILPGRRAWKSRLEIRQSKDVSHWGDPEVILQPELAWMRDTVLGDSVSNPCLVEDDENLRLFFSASLAWIDDCGFCEPRYIGMAEAPALNSPFSIYPQPILDPKDDDLPGALGAGSIKVLKLDDGWIGLQNKIYSDAGGSSRSAIFLLRSKDAIAWQPAQREPLVSPDFGWKKSHVYACDCRFREADGQWYLYFNARDDWKITAGRERIGRLVGSMPDQ
jgi:hypothetical protein